MAYKYRLSKTALKYLKCLSRADVQRVYTAIEKLTFDSRPSGCKKLHNREGWRIRIGNYRVIYTIDDQELLILVVKVGHRRDVYK